MIEEVSAIAEKKTIMEIYNMATSEPYNFHYVNLRSKDKNMIFHTRFDERIELEDI